MRRFSMRLRELRIKRGLTQAALAAKAGISREYLARLETGLHDPPLGTIERLAKVLKVKVGDLVGGGTTVQIRLGEDPRVPFLFAKGDRVIVTGTTSEERGVVVDGLYTGAPPDIGGSYDIVYDIERDGGGFIRAKEISLSPMGIRRADGPARTGRPGEYLVLLSDLPTPAWRQRFSEAARRSKERRLLKLSVPEGGSMSFVFTSSGDLRADVRLIDSLLEEVR